MPYENCERAKAYNGVTCKVYHGEEGMATAVWCDSCLHEKHWRQKQRELLQDIFTEIEKVFDKKIQDLT